MAGGEKIKPKSLLTPEKIVFSGLFFPSRLKVLIHEDILAMILCGPALAQRGGIVWVGRPPL